MEGAINETAVGALDLAALVAIRALCCTGLRRCDEKRGWDLSEVTH